MRTYGRLLRRPSTALSLVASFLSAVPVGAWPLAIVLGALRDGGSAADAGLVAAAFGIGNAVGIVTQGALLARFRANRLLPLFALAGVLAVVLLQLDLPGAAVAGAAAAGLGIPAVTPAVRGRFATTLPGEERPGAYALVNVLFQAGVALGPVLVAALAATALLPAAAPAAAACGLAATALLAIARVGRMPALPAGGPDVTTGRALRGVPVLLGVAGAGGIGIGVLQVLVPVRNGATVSGATFAVLALAEVVGAVLVGGRVHPRHAAPLLGLGAAAMAVVYLAIGGGVAVVPAAIVLGLATAVQSLGSAIALDRFVPANRVPAVFAVQIAVLLVGTSIGSLLAGLLPDGAPVVVAGLLALGAAATLLLRAQRLPAVAAAEVAAPAR